MNNIVIFYEPGAGGDFLTALLSYSPDIFGDDVLVDFHDNGRIKARGNVLVSPIDDYEYDDSNVSIEEMMSQQNFKVVLSKVHPYLDKNIDNFKYKLNTRYSNSKKIMLHRSPKFCFLNDQYKNAKNPILENIEKSIENYNDEWYKNYESIKINTDIMDVHFDDIITNPIRTILSISTYCNIDPNISEKFKDTYKTYISNQKYIEDVKRFWT
jgi:hypothetical protein